MAASPSNAQRPAGRPPIPRPPRAAWLGMALSVGLGLLIGLGGVWLVAYFVLGVTPAFILGLVRAAVSPPHTAADVTVPPSVRVTAWATGLSNPASLTFGPDGRLYVAELGGQVMALADRNGDGSAETRITFATGLASPLGLAFYGSDLYVGRRGGVTRLTDTNGDGLADLSATVIDGLPALRHQTDGLAFGPDGRLYIGQGTTSDRGETGILNLEGSILVAERDGSGLRVFASGTRNPYDLAFLPGTSTLFATDNGRDVPASGVPDELNQIIDGGNYGWPDCWGNHGGSNCSGTQPPVVELPAHSAVGGLAFYTGTLFPDWRNNAFVTYYGANSGDPGIGRKVERIELSQTGGVRHGTRHDFSAGLDRPLDVTIGPDGAIYVADFGAGIIYRYGK
jgi:putative membrane-bound dehydrogenase-like protein